MYVYNGISGKEMYEKKSSDLLYHAQLIQIEFNTGILALIHK